MAHSVYYIASYWHGLLGVLCYLKHFFIFYVWHTLSSTSSGLEVVTANITHYINYLLTYIVRVSTHLYITLGRHN